MYGGEGGHYNVVNNYYKYGPATNRNVRYRIVNPTRTDAIAFGKFYVAGNYVDGSEEVSSNNISGVHLSNGTADEKTNVITASAFEVDEITTTSATKAFEEVMKSSGASLKRDTLDQRIIENVNSRTGRIIDVQGGYPHGTPYDISKHAWPALRSASAPPDSDDDGMPDEWEKKNKLNPDDDGDASMKSLHAYFTNIEVYINSLVP